MYGIEIWDFRKRLTSVELKYFRITAGTRFWTTKDLKKFLEELAAEPIDRKLRSYRTDWLRRVTRMDSSRMLKIMLNSRPNGRRRLGRPLKRLLGGVETGLLRSNWWRMMVLTAGCLEWRCLIPSCTWISVFAAWTSPSLTKCGHVRSATAMMDTNASFKVTWVQLLTGCRWGDKWQIDVHRITAPYHVTRSLNTAFHRLPYHVIWFH